MWAVAMPIPVRHRCGIVGVGVAVVTEVRAGVVLADVFGHDATAGETLTRVFLVGARLPLVGNAKERIARNELRTDEFHKFGIMRKTLDHQTVVDAAVVLDAITIKVGNFAACSRRNAPALHKLADSLRYFAHLVGREFARIDSAALQVLADLRIRLDVDEAEHEPRRICRDLVAQTLDLFEYVPDRELVRENKRIKPPDYAIPTDALGEPPERLDTIDDRRHLGSIPSAS